MAKTTIKALLLCSFQQTKWAYVFLLGSAAALSAGEKTVGAGRERAESVAEARNRAIRDRSVVLVQHRGRLPGKVSRAGTSKQTPLEIVRRGTSSRRERKAAIAGLPMEKLSSRSRKRVQGVLRSLGVFRRLPTVRFEVDPDVCRFFTTYPDVAVSIWRAMKVSKFEMWQTGPDEYEADAGDGTVGIIDVLYRGGNEHLLICEGVYKSPLLSKPIRARGLIHLETSYARGEGGRTYATHGASLFVSFPSQTVETAARILSPVSNMIVDHNFREISLFLHMMSLAMQKQPGWVEQTAHKLDGVLEVRKTQLIKLAARVYVTARKRQLESASNPRKVLLEDVMQPLQGASADGTRGETSKRTNASETRAPGVVSHRGPWQALR